MTLPTPGVSLSMSQIQGEFGGSNPISLSEYYAGGAYVPAGTTGTNGAVPSSGTISISNFYGTSNVVINFDVYDLSSTGILPSDAFCVYRINSDGYVYGTTYASPYDQLQQWISPTSQASNYEVYATLVSGTLSGGVVNTWLSLGTIRDWEVFRSSLGTTAADLSFQIRKIGTTTILQTWTSSISAIVEI